MMQSSPSVVPPKTDTLQLIDIHLPSEPADWPPAYGWWLLLALCLGLFVVALRYQLKRRKFKQQRQEIVTMVDALEGQLKKGQGVTALADLNTLLKRIAIQYYPRQEVASLSGEAWLQFLDNSGEMQNFTKGDGKLLAFTPYKADMPRDRRLQGLMVAVRQWIDVTLAKQSKQRGGQ